MSDFVIDNQYENPLAALFADGIRLHSSKILIEPFGEVCKISHIVDRVEGVVKEVPFFVYEDILLHLKSASGVSPEKIIPQEGRICVKSAGETYIFHPSFFPLQKHERVCLHLHRFVDEVEIFAGVKSGLKKRILAELDGREGLILIGGGAESGRTAFLEFILRRIGSRTLLLEERIGADIERVDRVKKDSGGPLKKILPHFLSQSYEVLAVENVEAQEDLPVLLRAASAGKMVIATMYGRDPGEILDRLLYSPGDSLLLSQNLRMIITRRIEAEVCRCHSGGRAKNCEKYDGKGVCGVVYDMEALILEDDFKEKIKNISFSYR